jgi:hypothetical protein
MKLYEFTQNYLQLIERADEIDEDVLIDTIAAIKESLEDKAENIAKLVRSFEADTKTIKAEEERLKAKRKTLENQVVYLKKYLFEQLDAIGIEKIKRPLFTISIQANPPGVDVINSGEIPAEYWIFPDPVLDKKNLLLFLKTGETVPGATIKKSRGLRIR